MALRPSSLPRLDEIAVDGGVLAFTLAVSVATGLVFGLVPALRASRTDLRSVISEGAHQGPGGRRRRDPWSFLVAAEAALALVLLVGSGLLIRSFRELTSVEPGFATDEILTFEVTAPDVRLPGDWDLELGRREEETGPLRARLRELYPELPVDFTTMKTRVVRSVEKERFTTVLLGSFAALALVLAAIGIYGVVSYSVAQRTREMGIRIALGARPAKVVSLMLRDTLTFVALGIAAGLGGASALARLLESQLFDTSPTDPTTFVAMAALLGLVAVGASLVPARRTTGIDPILAIRED